MEQRNLQQHALDSQAASVHSPAGTSAAWPLAGCGALTPRLLLLPRECMEAAGMQSHTAAAREATQRHQFTVRTTDVVYAPRPCGPPRPPPPRMSGEIHGNSLTIREFRNLKTSNTNATPAAAPRSTAPRRRRGCSWRCDFYFYFLRFRDFRLFTEFRWIPADIRAGGGGGRGRSG
jgi:hypothetical protein